MSKENKRQDLQVHIGNTLDDMGRRFIDAWHRAERGELTEDNAERHVGFEDFDTFSRVITPKRLELLDDSGLHADYDTVKMETSFAL